MDINDPRFRLRVLNSSNPSIRLATAPQNNQPTLKVPSAPLRTPNIAVPGVPNAAQNAPRNSVSTPSTPPHSGWGGFLHGVVNVGKSIVHPFGEFGNALLHVPQAVYREVQNKPVSDIQQKVFGTTDSGRIAKKIIGDTAQIGLTLAAPGASKVAESLAAKTAIDAGIGSGFGAANAFSDNKRLPDIAKEAGIGGAFGGILAPFAKVAGKVVQSITGRGGDVISQLAKTKSASDVHKLISGVDDQTASFLAHESNPEAIRAVLNETAKNQGIPIENWFKAPNTNQGRNGPEASDIDGFFDPSNPPQSFLPPGFHAPNAPDPAKVLSDAANNYKSAKEFEDYVNSLKGEDKAVAESALNGKTPSEFYNASRGVADTVLHLPDQGVHAKLTPDQAAILADESKHIPFTAEDRPHLTAGPEVLKRTQEVSQADIAKMSPNAAKALENAQREIDKAAATASPNTTPAALLPEKASKPSVVKGEGFSMTENPNPEIVKAAKTINKLDQKIHDIQQGKLSATPEEARAIMKERQDLISQVNNGEFKPKEVTPTPQGPSGISTKAPKGDMPKTAEEVLPSSASPEIKTQVQQVLDQLNGNLNSAEKSFNAAEKTRSVERGQRAAQGTSAFESAGGGERGMAAKLKALGGKYSESDFNPIQPAEEVKNGLINSVESSDLMPFQKLNTQQALRKLWGATEGKPTPSDINYIRKFFNTLDPGAGEDVASAIEKSIAESPQGWRDGVIARIAGTPRALMATADLSGLGRQGAGLGAADPFAFAEASKASVKYATSKQAFEQGMQDIRDHPYYDFMKDKMNIALTGADKSTEEKFAGADYAEKIPIAGAVVRGSNRAYTGGLTVERFAAARHILDAAGGPKNMLAIYEDKFGNKADEALNALGEVINTLSGRGGKKGGLVEQHMKTLETTLFAPRLWASTFNRVNPYWYARIFKANPAAGKLAVRGQATFLTTAGVIMSLATAAGATVIWDPRNADFAKIKFGNTRYDILGGQQQNIRLLSQEITGKKIDSTTGEEQTLGADRGYGKPSRYDIMLQAFQNKENPLVSFATALLKGTDPTGQPINKATEFGKLFIPLNAQDAYSTSKDRGSAAKGIGMSVPGFFGVGVQTYGDVATKDKGTNSSGQPIFKGKTTPDMVVDNNGDPILDAKGKPIKVKFPKDATDIEKQALLDEKQSSALRDRFVRGLPSEDQALMKLNDQQLQSRVDNGKITQDRFDHIKNLQKTAESQAKNNQYTVPQGIKSQLSREIYQKYNSMDAKDQKYWLSDKNPPDPAAISVTALVNKDRANGLSEFKPSNALAKAYADYEKDINTHPDYSEVDLRNKAKAFQLGAAKLNLKESARSLFNEGSSSDTRTLIANKQIDKADLDAALKLDDELYNSGLEGSLKFSKKFRGEFGYGLPNGGSGGNSNIASSGNGSTKKENAYLNNLVPSNSTSGSSNPAPQFSARTRASYLPSFTNVNLPRGSSARKVNIKL